MEMERLKEKLKESERMSVPTMGLRPEVFEKAR